ncbi:hypothetical protein C4578_00185 [Candidatus Microgenomates bacterium]|nr:MAG: hypothetical protein C4578_00185 [Candidatus Microgenomates bacterium]
MKKLLSVNIGEQWLISPDKTIAEAEQFDSPGALISIILKNVYTLAGILLLVLLIFGGISIIIGAGENDPKRAAQGKKTIITALTGFLVIFTSYWIIQLISYITGVQILNPLI